MTVPISQAPEAPGIIIVDDSDDDLFLLQRLLRQAGVGMPVLPLNAENAARFFKTASGENIPLLCFLDVKMAGPGGFDVLTAIRANPALDRMAVVMLSSSDEASDLANAVKLGAQCYVTKFPPPDVLLAAIHEAAQFAAPGTTSSRSPFNLPANLLRSQVALATGSRPPQPRA